MDGALSASREGGGGGEGRRRGGGRNGGGGRPRRAPREDADGGDGEYSRSGLVGRNRDQGSGGGRRGGGGGGGRGEENVVIVGNLSFDTEWPALKSHIRETISTGFGKVDIDEKDGRSTGKGTVTFRIEEDALEAIDALTGTTLDGRKIWAKMAGEGRGSRGGGGNYESNFLRREGGDGGRDGGGRGGRKRDRDGPGKKSGPTSAEDLDAEMDAYMGKTTESATTSKAEGSGKKQKKKATPTAEDLDAEMEAYAEAAKAPPAAAEAKED